MPRKNARSRLKKLECADRLIDRLNVSRLPLQPAYVPLLVIGDKNDAVRSSVYKDLRVAILTFLKHKGSTFSAKSASRA